MKLYPLYLLIICSFSHTLFSEFTASNPIENHDKTAQNENDQDLQNERNSQETQDMTEIIESIVNINGDIDKIITDVLISEDIVNEIEEEKQENDKTIVKEFTFTTEDLLQELKNTLSDTNIDEDKLMEELTALLQSDSPLFTDEVKEKFPGIYDTIMDSLLNEEETILSRPKNGGLEPSNELLDLEDQYNEEGYSKALEIEFEKLAMEKKDVFAKEKLALFGLFEPHHDANFTFVFQQLREAADAGLTVSQSILGLLNLIDFGIARNSSISRDTRHKFAESLLMDLATVDKDFLSSLAVGHRIYSGKLNLGENADVCSHAVLHYHRCAESNLEAGGDGEGQATPHSSHHLRLADEFVRNGGNPELSNAAGDETREQVEYLRTVAASTADDRWLAATQRLGEMFFYGNPAAEIQPDQAQAAEYFQVAADAGEPLAQANFGMMLTNGIGVKKNETSAFKYFEKSAAQGNGYAMHGLGLAYLMGKGVEKNETKAVEYFNKAVNNGHKLAHTQLGICYLNGVGVQGGSNNTLAFKHFQLAADAGSEQSRFNLAVMYFQGQGTQASCEKALKEFRTLALDPAFISDLPFSVQKGYKAYQEKDYLRSYLHYRLVAELGSVDAQVNAAFLMEQYGNEIFTRASNSTIRSDLDKDMWMGETKAALGEAFDLYSQAALLNDSSAFRKLGACFHEPWPGICEQNHTLAITKYTTASNLGDAEATYYTGLMYALGDGIKRDFSAARVFSSKCSKVEFPANVPCEILLSFLDAIQLLESYFPSISNYIPQYHDLFRH